MGVAVLVEDVDVDVGVAVADATVNLTLVVEDCALGRLVATEVIEASGLPLSDPAAEVLAGAAESAKVVGTVVVEVVTDSTVALPLTAELLDP